MVPTRWLPLTFFGFTFRTIKARSSLSFEISGYCGQMYVNEHGRGDLGIALIFESHNVLCLIDRTTVHGMFSSTRICQKRMRKSQAKFLLTFYRDEMNDTCYPQSRFDYQTWLTFPVTRKQWSCFPSEPNSRELNLLWIQAFSLFLKGESGSWEEYFCLTWRSHGHVTFLNKATGAAN